MMHRAAPLEGGDGRAQDIPLLGYFQVTSARLRNRLKGISGRTQLLTFATCALAVSLGSALASQSSNLSGLALGPKSRSRSSRWSLGRSRSVP
jgi:hypothetical protein